MIPQAIAIILLLSAPGLPLAQGPDAEPAQIVEKNEQPLFSIQTIAGYSDLVLAPKPEQQPVPEPELSPLPEGQPPDMRLRIKPIGPDAPDRYILMQTLKVSPDSGSVAYRQRHGDGYAADSIALNGKNVLTSSMATDPTFSPDSKGVAVVLAERGWTLYHGRQRFKAYEPVTPVYFSPDGNRMFYMSREEDKRFLVDSDYAHPHADSLDWDKLVVTPNSFVIAYPAFIDGGWRMVINGDPGPKWDRIASTPVTTPNGRSVFFVVFHKGRYHIVDRHTAGPGMYLIESPPVASDDGRTFAYWAMGEDQVWRVYRNHKPVKGYEAHRPGQLAMSPDGQTLWAVLKRNAQWMVVHNKMPGTAYSAIGQNSLTVSPDGSRFAYAARNDQGWAVVVDGKEQATYPQLAAGSLRFSPDGRRFIYVALDQGHWSLIEGEKAQPGFSQIDISSIAFSPDSQRIAYLASNFGRPAVVLDENVLGEYDDIKFPTFSPDSKHLVYAATQANDTRLYADGFPTNQPFQELIPGARIHFVHDTLCQTVVVNRNDPNNVIVASAGKKPLEPAGPTFWRYELNLAPIPEKFKNQQTPSPGDQPQQDQPNLPDPSFVDVPTDKEQ